MEFSVTLVIVAITVLVSILANGNRSLKEKLVFNAYLVKHSKQYYRIFTHAFIHSGWMHLLINMWVLYMFGINVEKEFAAKFPNNGLISYVILYFGGIAFASLPAMLKHKNNPRYNALGASGAVASILYAFIILSPISRISLYFMVPLPAFIFGILYLWYEYAMDKRSKGNIAHDAHFYGALFGIIFMVFIDYNYITECIHDIQGYVVGFLS